MLTFCSCGYFVISNRAYSYECEHSTPVRDVCAGSRVNYSAPHSQNRISRCLLFAHVVTSSHQFCRTVLRKHSTPVRQNCATLNSLHVKTATSHKFSAQRIVGKAFTGHTQEIFQELQKSLGLVIFRFALVDLEQQRLCELL